MKKFLAFAAVLALLLAQSIIAVDPVYGTVTVDGVISEGEWDAIDWQPLSCVYENPSVTGRLKFMNDDANLYFLIETVDEIPCDNILDGLHGGNISQDCIELWINLNVAGNKTAEAYIDQSDACHFSFDYMGNYGYQGDATAADSVKIATKFDGAKTTVFEASVPLMGAVPGDDFGFCIGLNDTVDGSGRSGYIVLDDSVGEWWVSPKNLVTYKLAEYVAPETSAEVVDAPVDIAGAPQTVDPVSALICALASAGAALVVSKKRR